MKKFIKKLIDKYSKRVEKDIIGCGLVDMCNDNVKKLREWICKVYKIPREFLFNDKGSLTDIRVDDEKFNQFIEKLKSHSNG